MLWKYNGGVIEPNRVLSHDTGSSKMARLRFMGVTEYTSIPFEELRCLCICCQRCGTEVILDISKEPGPESSRATLTPQACPSCTVPFDSLIVQQIDGFRRIHALITKFKGISFRVKGKPSGQ